MKPSPMLSTMPYTRWGLALWAAMQLTACSSEAPSTVSQPTLTSKVAHHTVVTMQSVPVRYITSGTVTSDHRVSISSRLSGYIRDMKVREGDQVKEGQVLLRVDPVNAKQTLIQAEADLANAKADMVRYDTLLQAGAVTTQQADKVKLRYQVAQSQVEQAKHQLSYAAILSPVSGVVVEKQMSQGDLAAPGMPILTLEDPSSLLVETYVSEQFVGLIHEGDHVDVEISALKQHFQGTVRQVVQAADPVSHQFLVKTSLPSVVDIHPGMYAQTGFHTGNRQALLIPAEATLSRASGLHGVYVMDAAGITHFRQVRLGQKIAQSVEVLAGLHDDEQIVWDGQPELKTGMKVQL